MSETTNAEVATQHAMIGNAETGAKPVFRRNDHPDAQWFPEAGLGLFMHFGISSVSGECDLSWGMIHAPRNRRVDIERYGLFNAQVKLTPARYWAMAKDFTADRFDPARTLAAAKQAGFTYAVLTTKHHDGFALWPSRHGDFNIGRFQPGRDLVREYVDACRANGMKVGLYYSPPDWYYNRERMSFRYGEKKPDLDIHHRPCVLPERSPEDVAAWNAGYRAFIKGQAEELLTNYGRIDVFWFDGTAQEAITAERIRELQPSILINNRGLGHGDFTTPECKFPTDRKRLDGWWWEYCHVGYDGGWGYRDHDGYKPASWVLAEFTKARAWGGNFMPNYAPDSHGEMPPVFYRRMEQIAAWMQVNRESVLGVKPGPWPETADVPVTIRGDAWYLHFDFMNDGVGVLKQVKRPLTVKLLRTGEAVPFAWEGGTLTVTVPEEMRTTLVDVVVATFPAS